MSCLLMFCSALAQAQSPDKDGWIALFNGKNLDGWYSFLKTAGKNNDSKGVFKAENGMIHVLGTNEPLEPLGAWGYLATNEEYSDVRIHAEYKWGTKRFAPRLEAKRDSGLLYLFHAPDKVWPQSLEYQIQESDVGDLWLTDRVSLTTWVADLGSSLYSDDNASPGYQRLFGGPAISNARVLKAGDFEDRTGWNTVEVVLEGDHATHLLNGRIVNRAFDIKQPDPETPKRMIPLTKGRILLEAEGAEIWFRNIKVKPL
jgi:3-keto-disaccharide hydrolase